MATNSTEKLLQENPWWAGAIACLSQLEDPLRESEVVVAAAKVDETDGPATEKALITVTIKLSFDINIPNKTPPEPYTMQVPAGTVLKVILDKAAVENSAYQYTAKFYPKYGHMITSIDGVYQDKNKGLYWMIYESPGHLTPTGIDEFQPKDGSTTIFQYQKAV